LDNKGCVWRSRENILYTKIKKNEKGEKEKIEFHGISEYFEIHLGGTDFFDVG